MASTQDDTENPITFDDLGISKRESTMDTIFGKIRKWQDLEKTEVAFLAVSFLSLLSTLAMTSYIMNKTVKDNDASSQDFTLALLLLMNTVMCFYYVIHGVYRERPYEIVIYMAACIIVIVYIVINFAQTDGWKETIKLARLIAICILVPINFFLGSLTALQYHRSGNLIFRTVGAVQVVQSACKTMFFCEGLLKLDFQMEISLVVLILKKGYVTSTLATLVLSIGTVFSVGWLFLGYMAIRLEKNFLVWIFWALCAFEPAYIIYKVIQAGNDISNDNLDALSAVVFAFASVALITRVLLVLWSIRVYRNFGLGLKEKLFVQDEFPTLQQAQPNHPNYASAE